MYIHLITWMGLSANWIYMDIPQNIHFMGTSLIMMNHPISEVSYFQTHPSQCADTCKAPSYASMNCCWLYLFYLHVCCPSLPPTAVRFVVSTSVKESSHITKMDNSWQFNRFQNILQILVWRTQDISMPFASGWHPMNNYWNLLAIFNATKLPSFPGSPTGWGLPAPAPAPAAAMRASLHGGLRAMPCLKHLAGARWLHPILKSQNHGCSSSSIDLSMIFTTVVWG